MKVKGFKAAAIDARLRYKNRFDLGIIVADKPSPSAGVFTKNNCQAAPVLWSKNRLGLTKAFLANSGQANAQTGQIGWQDCELSANEAAKLLNCQPDEILLASTGVIGQRIKMDAYIQALPQLIGELKEDRLEDFADAIMTTDLVKKTASNTVNIDGHEIQIWGAAKGSGMIAPNMATMLAFVLTDANISAKALQQLIAEGAERTFNRITVDGDTSTNDSAMIMASCLAPNNDLNESHPQWSEFKNALDQVLYSLARQIVKDGEGANYLVEIKVVGAKDKNDAYLAAKTVAESPLVKTAIFGKDANWGRILMALGRSGAALDPYKIDIDLNEVPWIRNGIDNGLEEAASKVMLLKEYTILINLNNGSASDSFLTCDFSYEYVRINGDYRS